jgi:hypothetical protein
LSGSAHQRAGPISPKESYHGLHPFDRPLEHRRRPYDGSRLAVEELAAIAQGRPEIARAIVEHVARVRANLDAVVEGMRR